MYSRYVTYIFLHTFLIYSLNVAFVFSSLQEMQKYVQALQSANTAPSKPVV